MHHLKDKKPNRPDIQEILSRMKDRFINQKNSDNEDDKDDIKEENIVSTSVVESTVNEILVEKSPDDEIAELMLKLNGQVDEELVASIRSRKKMYENQSEVDSTSSATNNSDQHEQEKPRIILTLRPNENKPDSYVSSSNLTDYSCNSSKRKKQTSEVNAEVQPLKRSSRRSNDSTQSVLKSAIARKERTFSIGIDSSKKRLPKKIKKEPEGVINETNVRPINTRPIVEVKKGDAQFKEEIISEESTADQKKKKKKFFRGGRYNIFKKKSLQKERKRNVKKAICNKLNSESGIFDVDSSETNSERHSASVCSDLGTIMSSDKNYQDDLDTCVSTINTEVAINNNDVHMQDKDTSLCFCNKRIEVIMVDEGKIVCKALDCVDGKLILCKNLAHHLDEYGYMPMLRSKVTLPFTTFCAHHMKRFFLHHSCPQCGRFCSEGVFMMCKNKHFSHIGCHQIDKGCLHCGENNVYDVELKRHIINQKKKALANKECMENTTVEVGKKLLTTFDCPPEIDVTQLSKYLECLKEELSNPKRTMYSVHGLYRACELNDVKKVVSILGAQCNLSYTFPSNHNQTGLHIACRKGHLMIVYILLQAGVDPNDVDDKMKSPMRMAAKYGHSTVVKYLIKFNGAPEIKDTQGMTSLHLAAKNGSLECCKLILSTRASMVNWKDNGGWTPLVWACENGHIDVVKFFITHKPNTRISDDENNVALHWAAISGCVQVVKCLVAYDSEVNMFNDAGDTALHIAARKNCVDIVSFLIEKGAMAWHKNKGKKRPIDCCLPSSKCYNLLKNVPKNQRKSVTTIQPLNAEQSGLEINQTPVFVKTTPVLVSEDITHGCEDVPIRCVNEIDDEKPIEFTYIKENCYDVGNYVDSAMSHITSCNCEGACNTSNCKCVLANGECLYDENGCLNSEFDYFNPNIILYECNLRCKCHKQRCGNRVIQKGIKVKMELYRHKDMGWAVRARQAIPRGTFVCEYVGEIITDQKANDLKEDSYLFNLENPGSAELYCIDAFNYSNVSRFINHSCDPNLMSVRSFINHHDTRFPRIAFFAVQDIKENEQLCYDYGTTFWKVKGGQFTCKCGKANCSFSEETIKSLHIDSDSDEVEMDENTEQIKTDKTGLSNDGLLNEDKDVKIKTDSKQNIKLSKNNNLIEQKDKHANALSSKNSSITTNNVKQNYFKETMPKNGLKPKNKSSILNVVKDKKLDKNVSKQVSQIADGCSTRMFKSKLIQNKLQQEVMFKKGLSEKILNGNNSSLIIGKKMLVTKRKSCEEAIEKIQISNGKKGPPGLVKLTNNKPITNYVLRPKGLSFDKKMTENIIIENTVGNNTLKYGNRDNRTASVSSFDTLSSNRITVKGSNDYDRVVNIIKIEHKLDNGKSETELNIINKEHNFSKCPETSCTSERG